MPENGAPVVYVISSGSYSDYMVHAVFTTKEAAEAFSADKWYEIEEKPLYGEGNMPEQVVWYEGNMNVNQTDPHISERHCWPWEYEAEMYVKDKPVTRFSGWSREAPGFTGFCKHREPLERVLREKTLKYRAELDQLMRDVAGCLERLAGDPPRPVMVQELAAVTGRDVSVVGWAVRELNNMGLAEDVDTFRSRPRSYEEMEAPEPTEGKQVRIPIKAGIRPPKPSEGE